MGLGAVLDLTMLVGQDMGLGGIDVSILNEVGFDVSIYCELTLAPGHVKAVSPGNFNARDLVAFPIFCDTSIKILDKNKEVLSVALTNIFNAKVVDNDKKTGLSNTCGARGQGWWHLRSSHVFEARTK